MINIITHIVNIKEGCLIYYENNQSEFFPISAEKVINKILFNEYKSLAINKKITSQIIEKTKYNLPIVFNDFILQPVATRVKKIKDYINFFRIKDYIMKDYRLKIKFHTGQMYESHISEKSFNNYFSMNLNLYFRIKLSKSPYY